LKFVLTPTELRLLQVRNISISTEKDHSIDEALDILEKARDAEVEYAQDHGNERELLYYVYSDLADNMQAQIDDD
jgi:hypothetical protein